MLQKRIIDFLLLFSMLFIISVNFAKSDVNTEGKALIDSLLFVLEKDFEHKDSASIVNDDFFLPCKMFKNSKNCIKFEESYFKAKNSKYVVGYGKMFNRINLGYYEFDSSAQAMKLLKIYFKDIEVNLEQLFKSGESVAKAPPFLVFVKDNFIIFLISRCEYFPEKPSWSKFNKKYIDVFNKYNTSGSFLFENKCGGPLKISK